MYALLIIFAGVITGYLSNRITQRAPFQLADLLIGAPGDVDQPGRAYVVYGKASTSSAMTPRIWVRELDVTSRCAVLRPVTAPSPGRSGMPSTATVATA